MPAPSGSDVNETLAWESRYRTRTAIATIVAGNLVFFGGIALALVLRDVPRVGLLDGLRAAAGQPLSNGPGLRTAQLQYYDDKSLGLIIAYVMQGIGAMLTAATLGFLFTATKARRPELPRAALYGAIIGPILLGVSLLVLGVGFAVEVNNFVNGHDFSTKAAHDALNGSVLLAAPILHSAAGLLVAFAFVLVALNAMRVGLLSRFMGVLGVIVGALFVFPVLGSAFVVQGFWLIACGLTMMGRWTGGLPPAWSAGVAIPWPTQQELREQRGEPVAPKAPPAAAAEPAEPAGTPHSSSKKRKRKRR